MVPVLQLHIWHINCLGPSSMCLPGGLGPSKIHQPLSTPPYVQYELKCCPAGPLTTSSTCIMPCSPSSMATCLNPDCRASFLLLPTTIAPLGSHCPAPRSTRAQLYTS
jgi:hypothetical protein